jgi:hypothetical protein
MRYIHSATVRATALLASLVGIGATPAAAATCASLAGLTLPATMITAAQLVPAGTYTAPDGEVFTNMPAFCRIAATLTPTSDSDIRIEVWMPFSGWNGRYAGTGNGNLGGLIVYSSLPGGLQAGTAVANTDLGTSPAATQGGGVLTGHPEKQIDYATRSAHLMMVRSKQIIKAFYGVPPKYSYFFGCSTGGGQGIHEALQFPGDYDGILASAPGMNQTHNSAGNLWNGQAFDGPANITMAQATAVTAAVVKQCAGKDGGLSSDDFLTDPRDCHWDPSALQCTGGPADAPPLAEKAIKLSPRDPSIGIFYWIIGKAYFFAGSYRDAIPWLQRSVEVRPNLWYNNLYLVGAHSLIGDTATARKTLAEFHPRFRDPRFTLAVVEAHERADPNDDPFYQEGRRKLHEGLLEAGLAAQ